MNLRCLLWMGIAFSTTLSCRSIDTGKQTEDPVVQILKPEDGATYSEYQTINFLGRAAYPDGSIDGFIVQWFSDIDGLLNEDEPDASGSLSFAADVQAGEHTIALIVTEETGDSFEELTHITITNDPDSPHIQLLSPELDANNSGFSEKDLQIQFVVEISDPQQPPEDLILGFLSDRDGVFCDGVSADASGEATCSVVLSLGNHALEFSVSDEDGHSDFVQFTWSVLPSTQIDNDGDGFSEQDGDCDDNNSELAPNIEEIIDGIDQNCDGFIDNNTLQFDDDGDCFCEEEPCLGSVFSDCMEILGGDCADELASDYPNAPEFCDGRDNNCDLVVDEASAVDASVWYIDSDGDGFGSAQSTVVACYIVQGYVGNDGDCLDSDPTINPSVTEIVDGIDQDCDGVIDDNTNVYDDDGDGFSEDNGDCNDANPNVSPSALEIVNNVDDDCNGLIDDNTNVYDDDGDGFTENQGDCDDMNIAVAPNLPEICGNNVDDNCNNSENEQNAVNCTNFFLDADGDGYGPSTPSQCWCEAGGSSGLYTTNLDGDCKDNAATVHPGQTGFFGNDRGDGSFDYNCDGVEEKLHTSQGSCNYWVVYCSLDSQGWVGSIPPCGGTGSFLEDSDNCNVSGFSCAQNGTFPYQQTCR